MTSATLTAVNATNGTNGRASWEQIGARKRQELLASIPKEWLIPADVLPAETEDDVTSWPETCGWFTPEELAITNASATELIPRLVSGELSCEQVTRAFCKRAAAAHQLVCYTHIDAMMHPHC